VSTPATAAAEANSTPLISHLADKQVASHACARYLFSLPCLSCCDCIPTCRQTDPNSTVATAGCKLCELHCLAVLTVVSQPSHLQGVCGVNAVLLTKHDNLCGCQAFQRVVVTCCVDSIPTQAAHALSAGTCLHAALGCIDCCCCQHKMLTAPWVRHTRRRSTACACARTRCAAPAAAACRPRCEPACPPCHTAAACLCFAHVSEHTHTHTQART
jgi:hypothetical protein